MKLNPKDAASLAIEKCFLALETNNTALALQELAKFKNGKEYQKLESDDRERIEVASSVSEFQRDRQQILSTILREIR